ncbi:hypothetical protein BLA13014_07940 [Burkholderia aenigmatica]|jgi:Na+-transporting NADH:ubiquinone oxidoreductase subunit NqrD|uniref:Uncharacterized protein n=2 Tax=Burkholderia cepacia complex TaxID=87882 RepID=A0A228HIB1_9BURK|nr:MULTISPECIES: hypothetical protein [Burkholderia]HDR9758755.1 hypothetical protein [Burkholderia cepacia ATCC 25416]MBR8054824.1 hypothetical protein [Burkholderia vietnamiensis]MDN7570102.1 hypothetical protein [Burkholderia contaminans]OXI29625.1 hypothetical protein CFB84_43555 [Burkholderia aenigmatica]VWC52226.1 hypothetical protein BLA13014_07940 [Burkholderia aenigmatica]
MLEALKGSVKRIAVSAAILTGSGFILGSGIFPAPNWALKLADAGVVIGAPVLFLAVGFLIATSWGARRKAGR